MLNRLWLVIAVCFATPILLSADGSVSVKPRIIDGINVPASQFPTVGQISDASNSFLCSGTLIAPHFVLTAAHCAVDGVTGQLAMSQTSGRFTLGGVTYSTVHIYPNSTYHGDNSQEVEGAIDLCIFELAKDVPGVTPSLLYRQVPTVGTLLTLAGYGEQGTGLTGANGTLPKDGTVNYGYTPIDQVTSTFIKWTFNNVPAPNQESNTAPGDSGGPQFITVGGTLEVASVTSGGHKSNASFGDVSYNTRVDIAASWIDSITGGSQTSGNHNPTIQSLGFAPNSVSVGQQVTFTAAASDVDGDTLNYHWIFGDGVEDANGSASETHTFTANGNYSVQLIVTDGKGGSAQSGVSVQVGPDTNPTNVIPATATKKKFSLNFKSIDHSTLDFTLLHSDFAFPDTASYLFVMDNSEVNVYIGTTQIDSLTLSGTKGVGSGRLTFNYHAGTVRYQLHSAQLVSWLAAFGAANNDVPGTDVTVPLSIEFVNFSGDFRYGANVMFFYNAKRDRGGNGK
ncbi:MAG TPA: trypsin-like serine protease [Planctomycetota bacterium]|nr:trypsin-like serine protease [Planctomycetota bacterium]